MVVKTASGSQSGITHAGGRYVHPDNPHCTEVMRMMRDLGMEPPPPPFVLAPGEYTLYHEWGHHVDRTWSGDQQEIAFSFRWLSRFYELDIQSSRIGFADHGYPVDCGEVRSVELDADAVDAAVVWWRVSSELFADLFEDWMREEKKVGWDHCESDSLNASVPRGYSTVRISLLPGVRVEDVRAQSYAFFTTGIRSAADLPPVRPDLFGENTDEMLGHFRNALVRLRREMQL